MNTFPPLGLPGFREAMLDAGRDVEALVGRIAAAAAAPPAPVIVPARVPPALELIDWKEA